MIAKALALCYNIYYDHPVVPFIRQIGLAVTFEGYFALCPVALIIIIAWLIVTRHDVSAAPTREEKSGMLVIIFLGALLWPLALTFLAVGLIMRLTRKDTEINQRN